MDNDKNMYARRLERLGQETAFEVLAKANQLEAEKNMKIIHLEIGEPDFDTPRNITSEAIKALNEGKTHYTPSAGLYEMREKYAIALNKRYGSNVSYKNIVITPGAKPVLFLSALAVIEEGDEVVYPDPGYPIYSSVVSFLGAKAVPYVLREENDFRFDPDEFKSLVGGKTKLIILNTPQNPTGGVMTLEDMQVVMEVAEEHNCWILSDEVYSRIIYEGEHISVMNFPEHFDRIILLDGHSKTYAMTGWRLGFACCNEKLAGYLTKLMNNSNSCTAAFTQIAGAEALLGDQSEVDKMVEEFKARRNLIVEGLNEIDGVTCKMPKGAFYVFPNFSSFGLESSVLSDRLLHEGGVACLAGTSFGKMGEGYLRFSYANNRDNINEALRRIKEFLKKL